jgi:hypothetical protein
MGALAAATLLCALGHSNPVVAADWKEEPAPTSVAGGWAMIDKDMAQLESLIKAGKIGDLGSSAYGIANAFKGVSQLSTSLPPDKLADVQASVKVVGSQASKIDKAGEHNDTAGVQTNLQALKATLAKVRAYYPQ